MIPSVLTDHTLIDDIDASRPLPGEADIWWLGQSGYVVKTTHALLYFDPYLSDSLTNKYRTTPNPHIRMTEIPVSPELIHHAQYVFASHTHTDHFDPETLMPLLAASVQAKLILPAAIANRAAEINVTADRLLPMRGGDSITVTGTAAAPIAIHAIPAAHPELHYTEAVGYPFLGFVVQVDGLTFYHSGDTILHSALPKQINAHGKVDVAFLPINGAKARLAPLNIAPNLNASEALTLARLNGFGLTIPHHYDMFTFNTADVNDFVDLARTTGVRYAVLRPGSRYTVSPAQ